jgi:hypothetical protein
LRVEARVIWVHFCKNGVPQKVRAQGRAQVTLFTLYVREFHFHFAKTQLLRVIVNSTINDARVTRNLLPLTPARKISNECTRASTNALPVTQLSTALEYALELLKTVPLTRRTS